MQPRPVEPGGRCSLYNSFSMNPSAARGPLVHDSMVDAVLSASRVLVAIAARSLADAGEEVTLTQYRSLVVLASRGPQSMAALAEAVAVTPATASRTVRSVGEEGAGSTPQRPP